MPARAATNSVASVRRDEWQRRGSALSAEQDFHQIYRILVTHEFPWDMTQSLSFALFRTYAIPSIGQLLARTGVPARLLELEVTESAVMRYPDMMHKRLQEIRTLGIKMSIDDFGTGYASLAYLKHLPVDTLKIDKLFITNVDTDAGDRLIVAGSTKSALALSPYTGKILGEQPLSAAASLAPTVAEATVFLVTDDGTLLALLQRIMV